MPTIPIDEQQQDYNSAYDEQPWMMFIDPTSLREKPMMLFVDDRSKRIHYAFDVLGKKYDVIIAANVPEALRMISKIDWDYISLDHDLDGYDYNDPDRTDTGMEIIRYIEKTGWPPDKKKPVFIIHSSNSLAAHLMDVALIELGFDTMQKRIDYNTTT